MAPASQYDRERIRRCNECRYRTTRGCVLYVRPCSIRKFWRDQIDPPEKCPQRDTLDD
jgi:hypothetical protein